MCQIFIYSILIIGKLIVESTEALDLFHSELNLDIENRGPMRVLNLESNSDPALKLEIIVIQCLIRGNT